MATHPDEGGVAPVGVFFDFSLVVSGANPISIGNRGLLVHFERGGEEFPEPVLVTLGFQAVPGKQAGFDSGRIIPVLFMAAANFTMKGDSLV